MTVFSVCWVFSSNRGAEKGIPRNKSSISYTLGILKGGVTKLSDKIEKVLLTRFLVRVMDFIKRFNA
jgi:hypothetical protein